MRKIMKGRPTKELFFPRVLVLTQHGWHQAVYGLVAEKADNQRPKQVTGRRDGANRRHLPACSNFYLGIICDASTCSPSPGLNPHWSHVDRARENGPAQGLMSQLRWHRGGGRLKWLQLEQERANGWEKPRFETAVTKLSPHQAHRKNTARKRLFNGAQISRSQVTGGCKQRKLGRKSMLPPPPPHRH